MVARMRTDVMKREEKGIGPISFPRILISGLAGTFATLTLGNLLGFVPSCLLGVFVTLGVVVMTQPVSGTPMAQFIVKTVQGMLIIKAIENEEEGTSGGVVDQLVSSMNIDPSGGILECDEVFNVTEEIDPEGELPDMVFFRDITDLDSKGLQVIENPFGQQGS